MVSYDMRILAGEKEGVAKEKRELARRRGLCLPTRRQDIAASHSRKERTKVSPAWRAVMPSAVAATAAMVVM